MNIWEIRLPYLALRQNKVIIWNVISCDNSFLLCWTTYWVASIFCNIWENFPKLSTTAHWSGENTGNSFTQPGKEFPISSNWKNLEMLISKPEQLETHRGFKTCSNEGNIRLVIVIIKKNISFYIKRVISFI